jgi:hypothetical protein
VPIRFVQIGAVSGSDIALLSAVLRSSAIVLMGSGTASIPRDRFITAISALLRAAVPGNFKIAAKPVSLSKVEQAWPQDESARCTVFTADA